MSGFGDNFDGSNDVDPAADFLAREQDELAGLEDELKPAAATLATSGNTSADAVVNGNVSPSPPLGASGDVEKKPKEEPEKIRKWREEQAKRLEEKDREEEKKKLEWQEIAKKDLEDWYKSHAEQISKTKKANRNAEKQFVAEDDEIVPGTEWERIAKLCDFNPKAKQGSRDVSRMRSMILQMKQAPVPMNGTAAAGGTTGGGRSSLA